MRRSVAALRWLLLLRLLPALIALGPRPGLAADGFDFALDSLEVLGSGAFLDDFGDGAVHVAPTSRLVPRRGSELSESGGFLHFRPDDGAGPTTDPEVFRDELISREPIPAGDGQTETFETWRAEAPPLGSGYGLSLSLLDDLTGLDEGVSLGAYSFSGRERFFAALPAPCRVVGPPVVLLLDAAGTPLSCDRPPAAAFTGSLVLRARIDTARREADFFYLIGDELFFKTTSDWTVPRATPVPIFGQRDAVYPGAFGYGMVHAAYRSRALASGITTAPGGALIAIAGDVCSLGSGEQGALSPAGAVLPGGFEATAASLADLRVEPAGASLLVDGATLQGVATRTHAVRRVDPFSGRALIATAPADATCTTGDELDCLVEPRPVAPSEEIFAVLCRWSVGFSPLDPNACRLDLWSSQRRVLGLTLAQAFGTVLAGQPGFASTLLVLLGGLVGTQGADTILSGGIGGTPLLVALRADPADLGAGSTLEDRLTPDQRALLGCGVLFGTSCQEDGIRLLATTNVPVGAGAEAAALLQSFPGGGGPVPAGFVTTSGPQPGTDTVTLPFPAARDVEGTQHWLPGARGPGDPGYAPATDGSPSGLLHPFTGTPFRSELAALSWNFLVLLVAQSAPAGAAAPASDQLDRASPMRTDGCSFAVPQRCREVVSLLSSATLERSDDPSGSPRLRWKWETGASYAIGAATGPLGVFRGGSLHVLGPSAPLDADHAAVSDLLLEPPPPRDSDLDGVADDADGCPFQPNPQQGDRDGDGADDACDVCPYTADPAQADRGGIGSGTFPDGVGDACQCGDVNGDGRVTLADVVTLRRALLSPPTATLARPDLCDVGGSTGCTVADAAILQRALLFPPTAVIEPRCAPAHP